MTGLGAPGEEEQQLPRLSQCPRAEQRCCGHGTGLLSRGAPSKRRTERAGKSREQLGFNTSHCTLVSTFIPRTWTSEKKWNTLATREPAGSAANSLLPGGPGGTLQNSPAAPARPDVLSLPGVGTGHPSSSPWCWSTGRCSSGCPLRSWTAPAPWARARLRSRSTGWECSLFSPLRCRCGPVTADEAG